MVALHTRGPWLISERNEHLILIQSEKVQKSRKVHVVLADVPANHINADANAHLIAAAPELFDAAYGALEVLMGCVVSAGGCDDDKAIREAVDALRAAIRKVEDRS